MSEERFKNYVKAIESGKSCEVFLEEQKQLLNEISSDPVFNRKLQIHKALGHRLRYQIYKLIDSHQVCTCALARTLRKPDSTITYHVKILEEAGLVIGQKKGYFTIYSSTKNFLGEEIPWLNCQKLDLNCFLGESVLERKRWYW